jgi:hypothetical protein
MGGREGGRNVKLGWREGRSIHTALHTAWPSFHPVQRNRKRIEEAMRGHPLSEKGLSEAPSPRQDVD